MKTASHIEDVNIILRNRRSMLKGGEAQVLIKDISIKAEEMC
jgi:hypothetical protein